MIEYKSLLAEVKPKYVVTERRRVKIQSARDAYNALIHHFDHDTISYQEQVVVLYLNRANNTVGVQKLSTGSIAGCLIDGKIIFAMALQTGASGIIIAHNHPSNSLAPSQADINITNKLKNFGEFIDITIHDHLIITDDGFHSFKESGLI